MHCLGAGTAGQSNPSSFGSALSVVRALGVLVCEGRIQGPPRGYKEGPHCVPSLQATANDHACDKDNYLCDRYLVLVREITERVAIGSYLCVEVVLCSDCPCGLIKSKSKHRLLNVPSLTSWQHSSEMLLEYWCIGVVASKSPETMNSQGLYQAVRSRLHFSQVAAWWSRTNGSRPNYIATRIVQHNPGDEQLRKFRETPVEHTFPLASLGDGNSLKVSVWALPRMEDIPRLQCPLHPLQPDDAKDGSTRAALSAKLLIPTDGGPSPSSSVIGDGKSAKGASPIPSSAAAGDSFIYYMSSFRSAELLDDRLQISCDKPGKHHCRCAEEEDEVEVEVVPTGAALPRSVSERKRRRSLPCGPPDPSVAAAPEQPPLPALRETAVPASPDPGLDGLSRRFRAQLSIDERQEKRYKRAMAAPDDVNLVPSFAPWLTYSSDISKGDGSIGTGGLGGKAQVNLVLNPLCEPDDPRKRILTTCTGVPTTTTASLTATTTSNFLPTTTTITAIAKEVSGVGTNITTIAITTSTTNTMTMTSGCSCSSTSISNIGGTTTRNSCNSHISSSNNNNNNNNNNNSGNSSSGGNSNNNNSNNNNNNNSLNSINNNIINFLNNNNNNISSISISNNNSNANNGSSNNNNNIAIGNSEGNGGSSCNNDATTGSPSGDRDLDRLVSKLSFAQERESVESNGSAVHEWLAPAVPAKCELRSRNCSLELSPREFDEVLAVLRARTPLGKRRAAKRREKLVEGQNQQQQQQQQQQKQQQDQEQEHQRFKSKDLSKADVLLSAILRTTGKEQPESTVAGSRCRASSPTSSGFNKRLSRLRQLFKHRQPSSQPDPRAKRRIDFAAGRADETVEAENEAEDEAEDEEELRNEEEILEGLQGTAFHSTNGEKRLGCRGCLTDRRLDERGSKKSRGKRDLSPVWLGNVTREKDLDYNEARLPGQLNGVSGFEEADSGETVDKTLVPSAKDQERFRRSLENAASMVFHSRTGLPLTSSPAPLRRGSCCFDFDSSLNSVSSKRSALFELSTPPSPGAVSLEEGDRETESACDTEEVTRRRSSSRSRPQSHALLGSFEESALNGRLEPVSTVHGFTAEIGASGSFCPKHRKLPVTVFFYTLGDNDKISSPYLAHINLGKKGYQVPRMGTIQVTLLNPLGTVVKMFVVLYDLTDMPERSHTFLRQRTLRDKMLRYLIHLRFMSNKSGRIYLHTDVRMIICRKSDVDTASDFGSEPPKELRSYIHGPTNPKFSPRC